jgi:hypothetical protein
MRNIVIKAIVNLGFTGLGFRQTMIHVTRLISHLIHGELVALLSQR